MYETVRVMDRQNQTPRRGVCLACRSSRRQKGNPHNTQQPASKRQARRSDCACCPLSMMEFDMNQGSSDEESSFEEFANEGMGEFFDFSDDEDYTDDEDIDPVLLAHDIIAKLETNACEELIIEESVSPHIFGELYYFCLALGRSKRIRSISLYIPGIFVEPESLANIGKVLATRKALKELELQFENASGMFAAAEIVRHTRQISNLTLLAKPGSDPDTERELHAQRLADALRHHPALVEIVMDGLSPDETCLLTAVFPTISRLRKVTISAQDALPSVHPEALSHLLRVVSLRSMVLNFCSISDLGLHVMSEGLCTGPPLVELWFSDCQFPKEGGSSLAAALKCNTALKHLCFEGGPGSGPPDATFFSALKDGLSTNTTLTKLSFESEHSEQDIVDIMAAVRSNYGLEVISMYVRDNNQQILLGCILRLNKAGRRYMIEDPTCKERGVQVLEEVKNDLSCLFLHLQENPLLCMRR